MLFSFKSSFLAAAFMLGSTLVRAQFQGGSVRIQTSDDQIVFVEPGHGGQEGTPITASQDFPGGSESIWKITPAGDDKYTIQDTQFRRSVSGTEGEQLVTSSQVEYWTLKPLSDGFYAIQQAGSKLTWTSILQEDQGQPIYLSNEDGSAAQQFTFVDSSDSD